MSGMNIFRFDYADTDTTDVSAKIVEVRTGHTVEMCLQALSEYRDSSISANDVDILRLACAVAYVDRTCKRRKREWKRRLHVDLCVLEAERWSQPEVTERLRGALNYLTGDDWTFAFRAGGGTIKVSARTSLFRNSGASSVVTYSGGLDSYCGVRSWIKNQSERVLIVKVQSDPARVVEGFEGISHSRVTVVGVPFHIRSPEKHFDPSYRSRTFVFMLTSAVASRLAGSREVRVCEAGQGALGPSLAQIGDEWPYVSTSPMFSHRLSMFLDAYWAGEWSVKFVHPVLWLTKSQVLSSVQSQEGDLFWMKHRSCSNNIRRQGVETDGLQCGYCSNCLLRRVSLHASGLSSLLEGNERYYWSELRQGEFSISNGGEALGASLYPSQRRLAVTSIANMALLGRVRHMSHMKPRIAILVRELSEILNLPEDAVQRNLSSLLDAHHQDWQSALNELPSASFIRLTNAGYE